MKVSLRIQLLIAIGLLVIMAVLISSSLMYGQLNKVMLEQITNDMENTMKENARSFDDVISYIYKAGNYIGINEYMTDLLYSSTHDPIERTKNMNSFISEYRNMYGMLLNGNANEFMLCFILNHQLPLAKDATSPFQGNEFAENDTRIYNDSGSENEIWYQDTLQKAGMLHVFNDLKKKDMVYISKVIRHVGAYNNKILGISVVGVNFKKLMNSMSKVAGMTEMQIAISDADNNVISKKISTISEEKIKELLQKANTLSYTEINNNNQKNYVYIRELSFGFKMISIVSEAQVKFKLRAVTEYVVLSITLILFAVILISGIISVGITRPIKKLSSIMEAINQSGDIEIQTNLPSATEVSSLYVSFNRMMYKISNLIEDEKKAGIREKELEIKMLQAQIKPHYLYNALDSIAWTALMKNEDEIANMITALSDGFRYSIKETDALITIAEELEFLKGYVKLQELRYEGKFRLEAIVSDEDSKMKVPKFVIQPLVENSIIHGTKKSENQIFIQIKIFREGDLIKIYVSDNGMGFDAQKLNKYLNGDLSVFSMEKIGIKNINEHIKLRFGDAYNLQYKNEAVGITAIVTLPVIF